MDGPPDEKYISCGPSVKIIGLPAPLSREGILDRTSILDVITSEIEDKDFLIARLPSELGIISSDIARKLNKPYITEVVASALDCLWHRGDILAKIYAPILEWRTKRVIRKASHVLYVTLDYLQSRYPTTGLTVGCSDVEIESQEFIKKSISHKKKIVLGVIANPALKLKGIASLVKALDFIDYSIELQIVGGSVDSFFELRMASDYRIKQIGVIAEREQIYKWFTEIDIYIQPSFTEGLPRSIIEAMSFSIPILGSNVGGIPELAHPSMLFEPGNSMALAKMVNEIISDFDTYNNLNFYSWSQAQKFTTVSKTRDDFFNLFISSL
ncbi:glycosyltransferase [Vibrio hepatarius]|uniref:glycosyltransferase n=1 Tax=Vibrio hepatarius TaxID=171383 RepID=UPI001C0A2EB5|nr:glycosyltransferase family 4 protein [Vibrio hepatarius]